ncbi:putative membrane protein [Aggregatibacter actinomycetemcomitans serotype e str. SC1083]|uniref:Putative membrane protein n=1 Tax=Aggregatibacter actinomycetemcomitans serotype e str. SC1083 TaxID=907488 RepID=G4A8K6_AGGAC|nr:hypothetical protein [Aggregatibacter actinomycetemcomitans]EGY33921.1 putative membrane protein [Aggregatibacter actinomycetemcomitans serotype e str. SC1083]
MKKSTALSVLYALFLTATLLLFGYAVKKGDWLETDLRALLPQEQGWTAVQVQADAQQEARLNQQVISFVGHSSPQKAFKLAEQVAQQWQKSGLFARVDAKMQPDLTALRAEIARLRLATLPPYVRHQLLHAPQDYFQHYAEQIMNPFAQTNLLPLDQDWLGFGRFVLPQAQLQGTIQWHAENGMLYLTDKGKTRVLLRGVLQQGNLIDPSLNLTALLTQNRQAVETEQGDMLVTGAALFAIDAKVKAERESSLMSALGVSLTLLLLLFVFRTVRVLWLFLPIIAGMLCGVTATIFAFGQIHILTIVIGTSLIGVLIDFPLHWLASSLFHQPWHAVQAMQKLRFTFLISLLVTLLGYGLLGFTALPVLKQTALFSAVALITAMLATLLFLPALFRRYQNKPRVPNPKVRWILETFFARRPGSIALLLGVIFIGVGLYRSEWRDDILQWVSMPQAMLDEAKQIGDLTGVELGNRYFLVLADNDDDLLEKERALTQKLDEWQIPYRALSQWMMSEAQQRQFITELQEKLKPQDFAVLDDIGVPAEKLQQALRELRAQPPLSLQQALQSTVGQAWQPLYLGKLAENQVAGIVQVSGHSTVSLAHLANQQDIFWQDKRAHLNQAFQQTRDQAAWLKVLSFLFAGVLLWRLFGVKCTFTMLLPPLCAIVITVAIFGWIGLPISLFTMFGLLLVSAIGIDYTAYVQTANEPLYGKYIAVLLAAMTTLISFVLLGLSSTPAVASFGLSVSLGVLLSVILTFKLLR